jgi:hypothetical protein
MAVNVWKKSTSKMRNHAEKRKKKIGGEKLEISGLHGITGD